MTKIQNLKTELQDFKSQKQNDEQFQISNSFTKSKKDIQAPDSIVNQNELLKAKVKRLEETLTQKKRQYKEINQLEIMNTYKICQIHQNYYMKRKWRSQNNS
ncbi:unnamed protein product [Paramecium primaurelia]|uniref:Uncharacterized protein n=1 Tax=Paramecium primaurelia TaxID=5886 RepID=A0A8S1L412_PARPR|nr:unnamed protein product [Paramecium primaurelia]